MAPHSSTLAWKIPWTKEPGRLQSMGLLGVGHSWVTSLSLSCIGEGNDNPLQCSCLENPRDGGAWWAVVSGVAQSRTQLKWLSSRTVKFCITSNVPFSQFLGPGKTYLKVLCHLRFRLTPQLQHVFLIIASQFSVQFNSVTQLCPTLCNPMNRSTPGLPVHHQIPEFTQTHVHWVSDAIQPTHPLSSPSPPTFNLSQHQVFSNESVLLIRWPKYWSFSFPISPPNEYSVHPLGLNI